ncbi:MAG: rhomboid family intramembrane serine protease [Thermoplasmata archaeon]|nr:rhomboid family intramembrane serine protease [Thermoplasmata archaeon]
MNPGTARQYNSAYGQYGPPPRDDSLFGTLIKPNIVTYGIIVACVIVFIWEMIDLESLSLLAMWPEYPMPWMFVTSIFMHGGFEHIFFNMLMLFMFGVTLERMLGNWRFLGLFLAAGIAGNVGYVMFCLATGSDDPAIGASGAIYGVFACLAVLAPQIKVYLFMIIPLKIFYAFLLYAAIDIIFLNSNDSVAHAAHLAGAVVGVAFALYIRKKIMEAQAQRVSYQFVTDY